MKKLGPIKKSTALVFLIIISFVIVHIVQVVYATITVEPGSDTDPLVTQSYVDEKVNSLATKIDDLIKKDEGFTASIKELSNSNKNLTAKAEELTQKVSEMEKKLSDIEKYGKFEALELNENQTLIAGASAEIILRGGKAKAIGGAGGGLSDITSGTGADIKTDQDVPLNHLLLISRDDGRGIKAVSKKVWVLVKGPYTIQ